MAKYCAAYNCSNNDKNKQFSFHRFPKDPDIRKKWIIATKHKDFNPSTSSLLCSKHFDADCFEFGGLRKNLKRNAIPTLFDFPSHLQPPKTKLRRTLFRTEVPCTSGSTGVTEDTDNSTNVDVCLHAVTSSTTPQETTSKTKTTSSTPEATNTSRKKAATFTPTKAKLRRKVKILQQRLKRRDEKIRKFGDIIDLLRNKLNSSATVIEKLQENFSGFPLELLISNFNNTSVKKEKRRYSEKMKEFALTLYFYSPKAYRFLRKKDICLPNPSTIRRWLAKFNCSPGLLSEVFEYLKLNVATSDAMKHVSLVFDCMSIRKQLIYDPNEHRYYGYVDFGGFKVESHEELASEALVFQIVSMRANFKCVVAYFLINRIDAYVLSQLIKTVILKVNEVKVKVHNVTCDGPSTNISALSNLGCKFPDKPWFKLPTMNHNVCVTLDACHMLKLCRNTIADKGTIQSKDGTVDFKYLKLLNDVQKKEGLKFANKLSDKHIKYHNKKMNVQLAAQTLSAGVADALEFLKSHDNNFAGCEATVKFIRLIDRLFDFFNTRNPYGKHFKAPIKLNNIEHNNKFLKEAYAYLKQLQIEGISGLTHPRRTFILGFLTNITSIFILQKRLLNDEGFKYILTYKLSQDHLELFFSCVRSMGGHNDNPNVKQFTWAVRKLMFRNSVQASEKSNAINFDPDLQESKTSFVEAKEITVLDENDDKDMEEEELTTVCNLSKLDLSYYQGNIVYNITGYIVRKISEKGQCTYCFQVMTKQDLCKPEPFMDFVSSVNMGKLFYPSRDVFNIVCFFSTAIKQNNMTKPNIVDRIINEATMHFGGTVFQSHPTVDIGEH